MTYIILCILFSTVILIVFKLAARFSLNILNLILINYVVAVILGLLLSLPIKASWDQIGAIVPYALAIGALFIGLFFIVSKTTAVSGMTITSIASKMSVIFPAAFSIIYYQESTDWMKIAGMVLALAALFLSVYKGKTKARLRFFWLFPLVLFLGSGLLDSLLKFTQEEKLSDFNLYLFNSLVFGSSLLIGLFLLLGKRTPKMKASWNWKVMGFGSLLGLANFGSLIAMVNALKSPIDSSLVFFFNNTGVVLVSALLGIFVFRERLNRMNLVGIVLALVSIFLMSYSG